MIDFYDYLVSLSMKERDELGKEIGYSGAYLTRLASTRWDASIFLAKMVLDSKFNSKRGDKPAFCQTSFMAFLDEFQAHSKKSRKSRIKVK